MLYLVTLSSCRTRATSRTTGGSRRPATHAWRIAGQYSRASLPAFMVALRPRRSEGSLQRFRSHLCCHARQPLVPTVGRGPERLPTLTRFNLRSRERAGPPVLLTRGLAALRGLHTRYVGLQRGAIDAPTTDPRSAPRPRQSRRDPLKSQRQGCAGQIAQDGLGRRSDTAHP